MRNNAAPVTATIEPDPFGGMNFFKKNACIKNGFFDNYHPKC